MTNQIDQTPIEVIFLVYKRTISDQFEVETKDWKRAGPPFSYLTQAYHQKMYPHMVYSIHYNTTPRLHSPSMPYPSPKRELGRTSLVYLPKRKKLFICSSAKTQLPKLDGKLAIFLNS